MIFLLSNVDSCGISYYQYVFIYYGLNTLLNFLSLTCWIYSLLGSHDTYTYLVAYMNLYVTYYESLMLSSNGIVTEDSR